MQRFRVLLALSLVATAWASPALIAEDPPAEWDVAMSLPLAKDHHADPRVVEVNLEAYIAEVTIAGRPAKVWTYNGAIPGPLIRARVGDRLVVHFTNHLPTATTIHWHGLRVPIQMDGVPDHSQPEVKPGETFTYDFVIPDAGLYWYHPHVMSAAQVGAGLYGAFLVDDPAESFSVPEEHVIVLSDIAVSSKGELEPADSGGSAGMAFGREGDILLVNGRNHPRVLVRPGVPQRWRIVNAAKSRYFELDAGEGNPFTKIGSDAGLLERSVVKEMLVLAPGERADVFFTPRGASGSVLPITARLFDRGYGSVEMRFSEELLELVMNNEAPPPAAPLPAPTRAIAALDPAGATNVAIDFGITQSPDKTFHYTINGESLGHFPSVHARVGDTQIWTITNPTAWSHPFHLHGFFFQVLDKDGVPVRPLEWKDTVSVPYRDKLSVIVRYDDRPGMWMFHCHVLDHADGGLMGMLDLAPTGEGSGAPFDRLAVR